MQHPDVSQSDIEEAEPKLAPSAPPGPSFLMRFDSAWADWRPWILALWISRASVASVLLGLALFTLTDAVHDILRAVAQEVSLEAYREGLHWERLVGFFGWSFFWAITVHYTSRVLLWIDLGLLPEPPVQRQSFQTAFRYLPRLLGVAALATVVFGLLLTAIAIPTTAPAQERISLLSMSVLVAVEAGLFVVYTRFRFEALRWTGHAALQLGNQLAAGLVIAASGALSLMQRAHLQRTAETLVSEHRAIRRAASDLTGRLATRVRSVVTPRMLGAGALLAWIAIKHEEDIQPLYVANAVRNHGRQVDTAQISSAPPKIWRRLLTMIALLVVVGLGAMLFAILDPLAMAHSATQAGILFLILATWIPLFSAIAFLEHWRRFPVSLLLVLLMVAAHLVFTSDAHLLRQVAGNSAGRSERPQTRQALTSWIDHNRSDSTHPTPLILIATAGGGSRAAYWTARLLGSLQDADPAFRNHIFAISAVSGGALGSAIFTAILRHEDQLGAGEPNFCTDVLDRPVSRNDPGRFSKCGEAIAAGDFLAPPFVAFGYQDLLHWASGIRFAPDRASAIERAWEQEWRKHIEPALGRAADGGLLAEPFFSYAPVIAKTSPWYPALLFNGTSVGTGKRLIASHLVLGESQEPRVTIDAFDLFSDLMVPSEGAKLRLSTAVTIAARFPYVLPAGSIASPNCISHPLCDRVVDGGYFENFGAATAEDLLDRLLSYARHQPALGDGARPAWTLADGSGSFLPVVIQISSNPDLDIAEEEYAKPTSPQSLDSRMISELAAPPEAFYNASSARGVLAMRSLQRYASEKAIPFVHFNLRGDGKFETAAPLSWALSRAAQVQIDRRLCDTVNGPQLERLGGIIGKAELRKAICG